MRKRIAIVEDEPIIRANYREALQREGYAVEEFGDRPSAMARFRQHLPDLAIIDIGLGDDTEGGFDLCRELRAISATLPIMFLTARDSEIDQISGLRLGADDYLTKDISLPHMLARITALFRRLAVFTQPSEQEALIRRGRLLIDPDRMTVHWQEVPVPLTVTEYWMVVALAQYPGHIKSREQLMQAAHTVLDDSTITSHVKRIRRKFQQVDPDFQAIQTAYGMGYKWNPAEV